MEEASDNVPHGAAQRLDKWLWYARLVKTRSMAAALVLRGRVRVNRERTQKPSHTVRPGDVITASVSRDVRVLRVLLPGTRRGPASEAQTLYEDLAPRPSAFTAASGAADRPAESQHRPGLPGVLDTGTGRPSKKERRQIVRLKGQDR